MKAKFGDSEGPEKVTFPSSKCFSVNLVTFGCIVVGQTFNNVDFVVYFEEDCGHLDSESFVSTKNVTRDVNI